MIFQIFKSKKIVFVVLFLVILYLLWVSRLNIRSSLPELARSLKSEVPGFAFDIDQKKSKIDIGKLKQGCPGKDCIPSIDNPKFISTAEAEESGQIKDNDVVFGVFYKGVARAYPQKILNWHEIINDTFRITDPNSMQIKEFPVLITFCPLCGTAIGFERKIQVDGKSITAEFGVSGKLLNSNLVMYDRVTETLWQQLGGEAIVGDLVGQKLKHLPVDAVFWKQWKRLHPDTEVLSQDTGFSRDYSRYPYGTYESDRSIFFPVEAQNDALHPKAIVWGIVVNGKAKAYHDDALANVGSLEDTVGDEEITVTRNDQGQVRVTTDTGEQIVPERAMWFAWFAFHPETELYK